MQGKHDAVLGALEVSLQIVSTHFTGPTVGCFGFFRYPERGTTVSNHCHAGHIVSHFGHVVGDGVHLYAVHIFELVSKVLVFT